MNKHKNMRAALTAAVMAVALAGCGGGGGGESAQAAAPAPVTDPVVVPVVPPVVYKPSDVASVCGAGCSAVDASTYSGSGIGVWAKQNTTGADLDVAVAINGVAGQDVTLVFTNESAADVAFPGIRIDSNVMRQQLMSVSRTDPHAAIAEFNRTGWAKRLEQARRSPAARSLFKGERQAAPIAYALGNTRDFYHAEGDTRQATLMVQGKTADNVTVNFWVETTETVPGKVSAAVLTQLSNAFLQGGGIYNMLKAAGGPLWGAHNYPDELISGAGQPIDIVVLNFDHNAQPYGMVGYFWGLHNLTKAVDPDSNESLSLYLDSETMYLGGEFGMKAALMTMAHEGMHMSNFYRRGVLMGPTHQFDTWLEEMSAMMMEDAASAAIDPSYNPIRDVRLQEYLGFGNGNCALKDWSAIGYKCDGYSVNGSFGGFLLRQLGVPFFQQLLQTAGENSETVLSERIKTETGTSLGEQLRRFAVTTAGLLPANAPTGYGYPARSDLGFNIPGIDLDEYASIRSVPNASPASLKAYGNFMVVRRGVRGMFDETVRVPAGATLSVVIR